MNVISRLVLFPGTIPSVLHAGMALVVGAAVVGVSGEARAYDVYKRFNLADGYVLQIAGGKGDSVDVIHPTKGFIRRDHAPWNAYKIGRDPGDVQWRHLGPGSINIALRTGKRRDYCRLYAIRGDQVYYAEFHMPGSSHQVTFVTDNLVQHKQTWGSQVQQYQFDEAKKVWRRLN